MSNQMNQILLWFRPYIAPIPLMAAVFSFRHFILGKVNKLQGLDSRKAGELINS